MSNERNNYCAFVQLKMLHDINIYRSLSLHTRDGKRNDHKLFGAIITICGCVCLGVWTRCADGECVDGVIANNAY